MKNGEEEDLFLGPLGDLFQRSVRCANAGKGERRPRVIVWRSGVCQLSGWKIRYDCGVQPAGRLRLGVGKL